MEPALPTRSASMHPILHVLVVGFHHKRGCQVEYCYPPLKDNVVPDPDKDIPEQWTFLPSLALPDGAHNVKDDVIYFLLPSLENPNRAVFGISCYRQIAANDLVSKDKDVTRSSVQKSVVVLSRIPLFGVLKAKLELITQTYFNELDFSKVEVLHQMYSNLGDLFNADFIDTHSAYMDISLTPLLNTFRHRFLILFKLILLEKRVMFDMFPVHFLGDIVLGLGSLFPMLIDEGLFEAAAYSVRRPPTQEVNPEAGDAPRDNDKLGVDAVPVPKKSREEVMQSMVDALDKIILDKADVEDATEVTEKTDVEEAASKPNPSSFKTDAYGFPLSLFTKGSLFHPYLSISYLDMIRSDSTRAYCIGVTNAIFKTRRDIVDVIVTVDEKGEGQIEILCPELKRQLALTTQDLRFADFILKMREMYKEPALWEGSCDWVRSQCHQYLVAMLNVASSDNAEAIAEFNEHFITALRTKHNFRVWSSGEHWACKEVPTAHPFAGQLSVNDVFLRMGHYEQGRRMISSLSNTGRYMTETGSRFKQGLSSWMRSTANRFNYDVNPENPTEEQH
uniref:UDENN domain-containing protein n=1 Tax=Panagrellus redivivus TaxID=6233 RepID=A0A7E4ZZP2_PANRE